MQNWLIKGQKISIGQVNEPALKLIFELTYHTIQGITFDIDPFLFSLDENNRVKKDDIIFFNHPQASSDNVQYSETYTQQGHNKIVEVNLEKTPNNIHKIVLVGSIYREIKKQQRSIQADFTLQSYLKKGGTPVFGIQDTIDLVDDKTIIFGEIYQYKGQWKFSTIKANEKMPIMDVINKLYP